MLNRLGLWVFFKEIDIYQLQDRSYFPYNRLSQVNFSFLRMFFLYSFGYIKRMKIINFIENMHNIYKDGLLFELVYVSIDNDNQLVYFSESYDDYCNKPQKPEINKLLENENFIELCKMDLVDYTVMTKDNFIHLLFAWDKIVDTLPPFALLYQDDQGWYDVMPFESQEAMDEFIADHTAIANIHE